MFDAKWRLEIAVARRGRAGRRGSDPVSRRLAAVIRRRDVLDAADQVENDFKGGTPEEWPDRPGVVRREGTLTFG